MSNPVAKDFADMPGLLYVVATPIGNLEDVTRRGVNVLSSVAKIAAEDTRRTRVLLEAVGVQGPELVALHSHNERAASLSLLESLRAGRDVALVSDAGTPLLSDPGFELVRACWSEGFGVIPVPGASALLAALSVSPIPCGRFYFEGFLPAKAAQRKERLSALAALGVTVVFFEAPHRVGACLEDLASLVPERRLMVGREMTKRHEQYLCDTPAAIREVLVTQDQLRGEFIFVLEGLREQAAPAEVRRTMETLCRELPPAQAARLGAQLLGCKRRELYTLALSLSEPG